MPHSIPRIAVLEFRQRDVKEFMALIDQRSGDELYRMADKLQASTTIQSALAVQAVVDILRDSDLSVSSIEDVQKIISSLNRAVASVNQSLKMLGISGESRKDEVKIDPLIEMLRKIDISKNTPPMLQEEFFNAQKDTAKFEEGPDEDREVVAEIKKPIKAYTEAPIDGDKETVVDVEISQEKEI